jgi:hypothetical protein
MRKKKTLNYPMVETVGANLDGPVLFAGSARVVIDWADIEDVFIACLKARRTYQQAAAQVEKEEAEGKGPTDEQLLD